MKRLIYILIISICLFPSLIEAEECTDKDRTRLQKQADNVTYILEEYEEDGQTYFKTTFSGVSKEIRIYSDRRHFYYYNYSTNPIDEFDIDVYPGTLYKFTINGSNKCKYTDFRTITINIPYLNQYYNNPVCNGLQNLNVCQRWSNVNLSYEGVTKMVNEYKEKQNDKKNNTPSNTRDEKNNFDFMKLYNKLYWPTFIGLICVLILLIILWNKENKKNKL